MGSRTCQSRSLVSENAAVPSLHVPIVVDEFCLPVKVSQFFFKIRFTAQKYAQKHIETH